MFAAVTAVLAKAGVQQVDADLATLLRTLVRRDLVAISGKWRNPLFVAAGHVRPARRPLLATGASWVCYLRASAGDASRAAAVDKLSLALVVEGGSQLARSCTSDWMRAAGSASRSWSPGSSGWGCVDDASNQKTAFITGATSAGAAAKRFVEAGWQVIGTGRRADRLNALKAELGDASIRSRSTSATKRRCARPSTRCHNASTASTCW